MEINKAVDVIEKNENQLVPELDKENMDLVDTWFLMGSPFPVSMILASYLLFVLKIGPAYMKNRVPYKFQNVMILYNAVQVLISTFLFYICTSIMATNGLVPRSCVMEIEDNRKRITAAMYYYLLAKITELLDTIFFVLRKKVNQVSFLHVYHHTLMVVVTWTALKYEPSYALMFLGTLNSFVHMVMYTYYGLSAFPNMTKYLWWKKYITTIQLIQFVLVLSHFAVAVMKSECTPSYIMTTAMTMNILLFLYLFGSFYVKTYKTKAENNKEMNIRNGTTNKNNDIKVYQNGKKLCTENGKTASITFNDTYQIKFNLASKKSG